MQLNKENLKNITAQNVIKPPEHIFELPDKVLQFGTGVLLRGLCDYFIDKANRNGIFNGRVVVVKSTGTGDATAFDKQDNLYTLCVRGIVDGNKIEENIISSAINRVLSARQQWKEILKYAHNRHLQVIISNTTEVGLQLVKESIHQTPPSSFPAKLLAFLYERYQAFVSAAEAGMIIIPTELITDNGKKLFHIVEELAYFNHLDEDFISWLKKHNRFCNSLVDRIVPGKPDAETLQQLQNELGYEDELLSVCEVYRLWAIEGDYHEKNILSFFEADEGVIIEPHIEIYKELKLRLLNGTHTLTCGLAYLSGFATVKEGMNDASLSTFISDLMLKEIAQAVPYPLPDNAAYEFGMKVLDRFRNPYLQHQWLNITLQYTSKMKMRNIPILVRYYELYDTAPKNFALGFAAYLLFMKAVKKEGEKYYGERNAVYYPINDDEAFYFYEVWQNNSIDDVVTAVLHNQALWGVDISHFYDFTENVKLHLKMMLEQGVAATLAASQQKEKVQ